MNRSLAILIVLAVAAPAAAQDAGVPPYSDAGAPDRVAPGPDDAARDSDDGPTPSPPHHEHPHDPHAHPHDPHAHGDRPHAHGDPHVHPHGDPHVHGDAHAHPHGDPRTPPHDAHPHDAHPHDAHPHAHVEVHEHPHDADGLREEDIPTLGMEPAEEDDAHLHPHAHVEVHQHPHDHPTLGVTAEVEAPRPSPRPPASASELDIEPGILRDVPRRSADELLSLAPGVLTNNHNGEGHAPTIYLRGFDAGEGQDIEVLVDGIPINEPSNAHGHGYADPRFVLPELVRSVRVLQGPFDPRQGDFAVAGTVEYRLGMERRGLHVRGEYGSFDTRRLALAWAPEGAEDGTFVGVEVRDGAGFGPNRAHFGAGALGRYEHRANRELSLFVLGATQAAQFDSAGVVRNDAVAALECGDVDPSFCVVDPNQGGSASRHLLALGLVHERATERVTQIAWGSYRQLRVRENFTGQLLDARGDGLDEQYEVGTVGLRGSYRVRIPWDGRNHHLELGWLGRHDAGDTRSWRVRRELGVPYATVFDAGLNVTDIGAWVLGEVSPHPVLELRGGVRVDALAYHVVDRDLPTSDRMGERLPTQATDAFGIAIQPRGTVGVRLHDALTWMTSYGVGTRSSDAIALSEGERAPFATAIGSETGLVLALAEERVYQLRAHAGLFHTYVDRELIFDPSRGRNVPAGASNRYGAFAYARFRYEHWLDAAVSFAWAEANTAPEGVQYFELGEGARVPFVPRWMGRVDLAGRERFRLGGEPFGAGAAGGLTWVGPRPLPNGAEGDAYALVDVSAHVAWRFVEVGLMIQNLFDVRWERASFAHVSRFDPERPLSMTPARHFAAGPPLTAFLTLTLHLTPIRWLRGDEDEE